MANVKKDSNKNTTSEKQVEQVKETVVEKTEIRDDKYEFLLQKIAELQDQLERTKQSQPIVVTQLVEEPDEYIDIPLNKSIKVMSLYNGGLTLFTQDHGQGKKFRFDNFGDVRTIQYTDLEACIAVQHRFFEEGYVRILNSDVVKIHGFEDAYKKILTKKQIEEILTYDDKILEDMIKKTTDHIRRVIVSFAIDKILNNEFVDMNKVNIIGKFYPRDINEIIAFLRESQAAKKEG